jgi:hypothetical protein
MSAKKRSRRKKCKESGCDRPAKTRGWCQMHYYRLHAIVHSPAYRRNRQAVDEMIECLLCGRRLHALGSHLRIHDMTVREYRARFPEAPTASAHFRALKASQRFDQLGAPYWTPERIVAAMRRWAKRTGRVPSGTDWDAGRKSRPTGLQAPGRGRPSAAMVKHVFGSWSAAIAAAGPWDGVDGPRRRGRDRTQRTRRTASAVAAGRLPANE